MESGDSNQITKTKYQEKFLSVICLSVSSNKLDKLCGCCFGGWVSLEWVISCCLEEVCRH